MSRETEVWREPNGFSSELRVSVPFARLVLEGVIA